jgi:TIR domain/VHL beta domain/Lysozyme inhibitor LprI
MAHDVFIGYSARDKPAANAICAKLEASGIRCWIAPRDIRPGMSWGGAIVEAIDRARLMVLLFSSHANSSPQIQREVERAVHRELVIVPVRVEDAQPSGDFEYFLGTPHWLDAITPPFEQHLDAIVDSAKFWLERIHANQGKVAPAEIKAAREVPRPTERTLAHDTAVPKRRWLNGVIVAVAVVVVGIGGFFVSRVGGFFSAHQTAQEHREDQGNPSAAEGVAEQNPASSVSGGAAAPASTADPQTVARLAALHLRSTESSIPATIRFTNQLTSGVVGYWIDFDGTAERYVELGPAGSMTQPTYQDHVWVVVDDGGRPLRTYTAKAGDQNVMLTAAGFDCSKAISPSEKRICADPTLADLDQEMAAAYRNVIQNTSDVKGWKADQLQWLAERDRCQEMAVCVRNTATGW